MPPVINVLANGWGVTGITVAQSGEPFSVIDFSGTAGAIFFSADDFVTNPILPFAPGISPKQAQSKAGGGGTLVGFNNEPYVDPNSFAVPLLTPGEDGVPPCQLIFDFATVSRRDLARQNATSSGRLFRPVSIFRSSKILRSTNDSTSSTRRMRSIC